MVVTPKFYQVGGSVRDNFLSLPSKDIDWAVEAPGYAEMRQAILERGGEIFLERPEFFTIRARVPLMGGACDFVLCRKEANYTDGRHPSTVTPGTIYDDLARRDFTINAMAFDEAGMLLDPHNGSADLEDRFIRCVGNTKDRFTEDGLRMVRALRFSITKDLILSSTIGDCLRDPEFFTPRLLGVSTERIREELTRCFASDTVRTLYVLEDFIELRDYIFSLAHLWLKPTMEAR